MGTTFLTKDGEKTIGRPIFHIHLVKGEHSNGVIKRLCAAGYDVHVHATGTDWPEIARALNDYQATMDEMEQVLARQYQAMGGEFNG